MANADVFQSRGGDIAMESTAMRAELKEWEKAFAAANGGRKAGRDDIKKDPEVAAKYKAYARLRSLESSSSGTGKENDAEKTRKPRNSEETHSKKRKHGSPTGPGNGLSASTPRKAAREDFLTPKKGGISNVHPSQLDPYDSPSTLRRLFSPTTHHQVQSSPLPLKTAIGPTPQRDGRALGLFDLLSASGGSSATPSAKRLSTVPAGALRTPSRKKNMDTIREDGEEEDEDNFIFRRTPASSSKKFMLSNFFATPTTLRYAAMVEEEENGVHNRAISHATTNIPAAEEGTSETPSFLRRSNSGRFGAPNPAPDGSGLSPIAVRKPPRFVGKGLSALVQGLRDMEEERMEDDWDVLRELETEQAAETGGNDVQVGDSQVPTNGEEAPRRPWKKKGQKRTTRRVTMRPVLAKPKPAPEWKGPENDAESEDELAVTETQRADPDKTTADDQGDDGGDAASLHTASEPDLDSDSDYDESSGAVKKTSSFSEKMKAAFSSVVNLRASGKKGDKPDAAEKEAKVKEPAARKVNPQAHANYRSLKIRNKNSKGKGRFSRRR